MAVVGNAKLLLNLFISSLKSTKVRRTVASEISSPTHSSLSHVPFICKELKRCCIARMHGILMNCILSPGTSEWIQSMQKNERKTSHMESNYTFNFNHIS